MDTKLIYNDAVNTVKGIVTPMIDGTKIEILQCNVLTVMVVVQYIALALLALCK